MPSISVIVPFAGLLTALMVALLRGSFVSADITLPLSIPVGWAKEGLLNDNSNIAITNSSPLNGV